MTAAPAALSRVAITGSIATDHLMSFPGRFAEQLLEGQLHRVSLSFLVDSLDVRRGGVAANIAFGMGVLGHRPLLVGSVGEDFATTGYRAWLERHGVDCTGVRVSELRHTARFLCTTDLDHNQIASFYTGAMAEAREIELAPLGDVDLVVVSPNDPAAMLRHTAECRSRGVPFVADPSQQLARIEGDGIRQLIDGAAYLFTNQYEKALTESKTGWTSEEVLTRVGVRITTLGADGALIEASDAAAVHVPVPAEERKDDPTGVGDAFRAGFLAAVAWGCPRERAAQVGSLLATLALESVGTQEYVVEPAAFASRLRSAYGDAAAADVAPHLLPAAA